MPLNVDGALLSMHQLLRQPAVLGVLRGGRPWPLDGSKDLWLSIALLRRSTQVILGPCGTIFLKNKRSFSGEFLKVPDVVPRKPWFSTMAAGERSK